MITAVAIIQNGVIYKGEPFKERHHHVIHTIATTTGIRPVTGRQGFVTDSGEFLDREQAAEHARACGQITELKFHSKQLFSEDVW